MFSYFKSRKCSDLDASGQRNIVKYMKGKLSNITYTVGQKHPMHFYHQIVPEKNKIAI